MEQRRSMPRPTIQSFTPRASAAATPEAAPVAKPALDPVRIHEEIQSRAFEIFLARNGAPGDPLADWVRAEREIAAKYGVPVSGQ
jgi:hypothetical protein